MFEQIMFNKLSHSDSFHFRWIFGIDLDVDVMKARFGRRTASTAIVTYQEEWERLIIWMGNRHEVKHCILLPTNLLARIQPNPGTFPFNDNLKLIIPIASNKFPLIDDSKITEFKYWEKEFYIYICYFRGFYMYVVTRV